MGDRRVESHRIVEILNPGALPAVRTKGDANRATDPWNAQLAGETAWVVTATVPELGFLILWMRNPNVRLASLFLAPGLLVVRTLLRIWLPGGLRDLLPAGAALARRRRDAAGTV